MCVFQVLTDVVKGKAPGEETSLWSCLFLVPSHYIGLGLGFEKFSET